MSKKMLLPLIVSALFFLTGLAAAAWSVQKSTENFLTTASYRARILEEYQIPKHVDPSQTIKKKVHIKNEGTIPILVRVMIEKAFGKRFPDGSFQEDPLLDPEMIEIQFRDRFWKKDPDGWFYYTKILEPGTETEEPLMESYTLSEEVGNEYKGKDAQIIVKMESVQAEGDGCGLWGKTEMELGLEVPLQKEKDPVQVFYDGKENGFMIQAENTDLFAAFKNLFPGCARTQKIKIQNRSGEEIKLFLKAEKTKQNVSTEKEEYLLEELLHTHAQIEVLEETQRLYQGPVDASQKEGALKEGICLGDFAPGETKELTVRLMVSPEMDETFQKLSAKVVWVFRACGEDGKTVITEVPVTGDSGKGRFWISWMFFGWLVFCSMAFYKKRRRENQT